ncbi:MAG: hypothetical protein EAZ42_11650 [Verrucomicrobia bacterium]|nr:MAG: hypothetical protein EAZ42_11650 [Verrucomicrobiota bacterium]
MRFVKLFISITLLTAVVIQPAIAEAPASSRKISYHAIPLDVGGWFSGYAVHPSGRLYGFGDVFGVWRSDDSAKSWSFLLGDVVEGGYFVNALACAWWDVDTLAYAASSGVFLSRDGGKSWKNIAPQFTVQRDRGASAIAFHPSKQGEIWIAASNQEKRGNVWRTSDFGGTWEAVDELSKARARTILIHPNFPDQIWVGADDGLHLSADGGEKWRHSWGRREDRAGITAMARAENGVGILASDQGAVRVTSNDWDQPSRYDFETTLGCQPLQASVMKDGPFLISNVDGPTWASMDEGLTWKELPMKISPPPVPTWADEQKMRAKAKVDYGRDQIVQDPRNLRRWYITGGGAPAVSEDGGTTWNYFPNACGIAGVMTYKVAFSKTNPDVILLPGSDVGVNIATRTPEGGIAAGGSHRTFNELHSFHDVMEADRGKLLVIAGVRQSSSEPMILRSKDAGLTWEQLDVTAAGLPPSKEGITKSSMSAKNPSDFIVIMTGITGRSGQESGDVFRTKNGGQTFEKVRGLADGMETGHRYHPENVSMVRDGVNDDHLYAAFRETGINFSEDGGSSWKVLRKQPYQNGFIWSMAHDRTRAGHLIVGHRDEPPVITRDGGKSWKELRGWQTSRHVDWTHGRMAILGKREGDTINKIYYSEDDGESWIEISGPGHRFPQVQGLAVDPWVEGQVWISQLSITVATVEAR